MIYKRIWYCRWDGKSYRPKQETDRDGFCSPACKQAHYRAYKKYVTQPIRLKRFLELKTVTLKKSKKRKTRKVK